MEKYTNIKNYLLNHFNVIGEIVSEINSVDNSLEFLEYWKNDEEFFNTYFYTTPMEAVRGSFFGEYNYCDEYVKFDVDGNLKSANANEVMLEYKDFIDDIVNSLLYNYDKISLKDRELIKLIKEIENKWIDMNTSY